MRKPTNLENRIRVRAYYMALWTGFTECPVSCWLRAEQLELALAERRSQAARKGAKTKRYNAEFGSPAEHKARMTYARLNQGMLH